MKKLNYQTLNEMGYNGYLLKDASVRALQFGEGNFLRAFTNHFIDVMNEKAGFNGKVTLVQPIGFAPQIADIINEQEGLYTLYLRGVIDGKEVTEKRVISCVDKCINPYRDYQALLDEAKNPDLRFILSNTTEAGIVYDENSTFDQTPPDSFPAKLTRFMYERFSLGLPGFIILSCELIDNNGKELEKCVKMHCDAWNLSEEFKQWVSNENIFCSTLVDRIVTGYPKTEAEELNNQNGYIDNLLDTGEIFGFWVIEGPDSIKDEFPCEKAGLPILITDDHSPYKQRKVRILNGAHTAMVPGAFMSGLDTVLECMNNDVVSSFIEKILQNEIMPTLTLPKEEVEEFARSVSDRFKNPYIRHELLSISLNSIAKWKARLMPSLLGYFEKFGELPKLITLSFASCVWFYHQGKEFKDGTLTGERNGVPYPIVDDNWVLEFFYEHKDASTETLAKAVIENEKMWGTELKSLPNFTETISKILSEIKEKGINSALKEHVYEI